MSCWEFQAVFTDEADFADSFELRAILCVERERVALTIGSSSEQCQGHVVKPSQLLTLEGSGGSSSTLHLQKTKAVFEGRLGDPLYRR